MAKAKAKTVKRKLKKVVTVQKNGDIGKFKKAADTSGVMVVMVLAPWCGACKKIKPELMKSLNTPTKYPRVLVDSEVAKNIPALNNAITRYPSFLVLKNGSPMDQVGPEGITKEVQTSPRTAEELVNLGNNPPFSSQKRNTRRAKNATPVESVALRNEPVLTNEPLSKKTIEETIQEPKEEKAYAPKYISR